MHKTSNTLVYTKNLMLIDIDRIIVSINLVLSKQHARRRKTVTMNKNEREQLPNRRQRTPRPDRRRGSRPTSARRPTCWGSRRRTSSSSRRPPRTPWPGPRSLHGAAPQIISRSNIFLKLLPNLSIPRRMGLTYKRSSRCRSSWHTQSLEVYGRDRQNCKRSNGSKKFSTTYKVARTRRTVRLTWMTTAK